MSFDPCQDFDQFACGGWRSRNPIPKSQSQWTQFKKLWQKEETLLRDLIERQANSSGERLSVYTLAFTRYGSLEYFPYIEYLLLCLSIFIANSSAALVYTWYSSCLNETEREKSGDKPLLKLILEFDSCPLISPITWFPFGWSFVDHMVRLNRLAIHPFFLLYPKNDLFNSSRVLLTVKKCAVVCLFSVHYC